MNVFETFYLLFKADATQLKKESADVQKTTQETTRVFKDSEEQSTKSENSFDSLAKSVLKLSAAYFSVGAVIGGVKSTIANTTDLGNLSRNLTIPVEQLDAWSRAVTQFGGDSLAFLQDIETIQKKFKSSPQVALTFLTEKLPDILKRLGPVGGQIFAQESLGLSPDTISFVSQGGDTLKDLYSAQLQSNLISKEEVDAIGKLNESIYKLTSAINDVFRVFTAKAAPYLTRKTEATAREISDLTTYFKDENGVFPWHVFPISSAIAKSISNAIPFLNLEGNKEVVGEDNTSNSPGEINPITKKPWDWKTDFGWSKFRELPTENQILPTVIPPMSNSQANNLYMGDVNINTTATDVKGIENAVTTALNSRLDLWQSNSYFDDAVVI